MSRTPTLSEFLDDRMASALESVHTALPGRVVRYDVTKQQADVQPLVKRAYEDEGGARVVQSLPVIPNCPVQFAGGAGLVLVHPVAVGDLGLLIFAEASLDKWLAGAGNVVDPEYDHRHHLADGIFIPGVRPFGAARKANPGSAICIGTDGGSFQGAALGASLHTYLVALDTWLAGLAGAASYLAPRPSVPTVESATVKITP